MGREGLALALLPGPCPWSCLESGASGDVRGSRRASSSGCSQGQFLPRGRATFWQPQGPTAFPGSSTNLPRDPQVCASGRKVCPGLLPQWAPHCPSHRGPQGLLLVPSLPKLVSGEYGPLSSWLSPSAS